MKAVGFFLVIVMIMGFSMEEESEIDEEALYDEYYESNDTGENATTVTMAPKIVETTSSAEGSG